MENFLDWRSYGVILIAGSTRRDSGSLRLSQQPRRGQEEEQHECAQEVPRSDRLDRRGQHPVQDAAPHPSDPDDGAQHPDEEDKAAVGQIKQTLEAVIKFKLPVKVIYPNADAGGRSMIKVINEYKTRVEIYPSVGRAEFLKLLSRTKVLIGNSSAGLIEAPSLNLPAVNIGPRQTGREQAKNVINVGYDKNQIARAINKGLNWQLKNVINPYGDGKTAERVLKFLKNL